MAGLAKRTAVGDVLVLISRKIFRAGLGLSMECTLLYFQVPTCLSDPDMLQVAHPSDHCHSDGLQQEGWIVPPTHAGNIDTFANKHLE